MSEQSIRGCVPAQDATALFAYRRMLPIDHASPEIRINRPNRLIKLIKDHVASVIAIAKSIFGQIVLHHFPVILIMIGTEKSLFYSRQYFFPAY